MARSKIFVTRTRPDWSFAPVRLAARLLALGVALVPGMAIAQNFNVPAGQTAGPQVLAEDGDVGVIEVGGEIEAVGVPGVELQASGQRVENAGSILVTGTAAGIFALADAEDAVIINTGLIDSEGFGLVTKGDRAVQRNSGLIVTRGEKYAGMSADGANSLLFNDVAGEIDVRGQEGLGMVVSGQGSIARNFGSIDINGHAGRGVRVIGDDALIENVGRIESYSEATWGIWSAGARATIINSGDVIAYDRLGVGVRVLGAQSSLVNTGRISATGEEGYGIAFLGADGEVTNYGTVSAGDFDGIALLGSAGIVIHNAGLIENPAGQAVNYPSGTLNNSGTIRGRIAVLARAGSTLNLLAGSVLDGEVLMDGSGDTVSFGPGLNARINFEENLPQTINSSNPLVIAGTRVTVLDRAGFVLSEDMALALAAQAGQGRGEGLSACMGNDGAENCHVTAWLNGVGGLGGRSEEADLAGLAFAHGGLEAGLDIDLGVVSAGAFASAAAAHGEVGSSQATDISASIFGGHVGLRQGIVFAEASASYGLLELTGSRQVADNLVTGGLVTGESDSTGRFLSPALVAGFDLTMGELILTPSLAGRYTQLTLSGYAEDGATDDLSVSERTVEELALRAQLALALTPVLTESGGFAWTLRAGADARRRSGEAIVASLAGSSVSFEGGGNGDSFGGFVGANLDYRFGAATLSGDVEFGLATTGLHTLSARATLAGGF